MAPDEGDLIGGLFDGDVGEGAGSGENGDGAAASEGEVGEGFENVGAGLELEEVGFEGVGGVAGDENGGFGFVFGARRTATWTAVG